MEDQRETPGHRNRSHICLTVFGNSSAPFRPSRLVGSGRQTEVGSNGPCISETTGLVDCATEQDSRERSDPRRGSKKLANRVGFGQPRKPIV